MLSSLSEGSPAVGVQVYYATNRKSEGQDDHGSIFGKQVNSSTNFGLAEVCTGHVPCKSLPPMHKLIQAIH